MHDEEAFSINPACAQTGQRWRWSLPYAKSRLRMGLTSVPGRGKALFWLWNLSGCAKGALEIANKRCKIWPMKFPEMVISLLSQRKSRSQS